MGRGMPKGVLEISMESLILAQDERWRRASHMQVERGSFSGNTGEGLVAVSYTHLDVYKRQPRFCGGHWGSGRVIAPVPVGPGAARLPGRRDRF